MSVPAMFDQAAFATGMNPNYISPGVDSQHGVVWFRQPFVYTITFLNILAAGVVTNTTNIQNDSYFVCTEQTAFIVDHATGNTTITDPAVAPMLVQIVDTSSGKFISDNPVALANWFGTGERPFVWLARAQVYRPGGQIQAQLTNNMATAQDVRLAFIGFKIYQGIPDDSSTG